MATSPRRIFVTWFLFIYLSAVLFYFGVHPSDFLTWYFQEQILIPSLIIAGVGTYIVWISKKGKFATALRGASVGFLTSFVIFFISSEIFTKQGEASAWYMIGMLPLVFASAIGGFICGMGRVPDDPDDDHGKPVV